MKGLRDSFQVLSVWVTFHRCRFGCAGTFSFKLRSWRGEGWYLWLLWRRTLLDFKGNCLEWKIRKTSSQKLCLICRTPFYCTRQSQTAQPIVSAKFFLKIVCLAVPFSFPFACQQSGWRSQRGCTSEVCARAPMHLKGRYTRCFSRLD